MAKLALRMMEYDHCSEGELIGVYLGRAEDVLSALDAAGLVIVPREGAPGVWEAGNRVRYVTHGETGDMWRAMLAASPFSVTEDPQP